MTYLPEVDNILKEHDIGKKSGRYGSRASSRLVRSFRVFFIIEYRKGKVTFHCIFVTELSLISLHWFLTGFASVVHMKVLLRIWDLFFYEGSVVLFQMTLGMMKMKVRVCSHRASAFALSGTDVFNAFQ